tara:strand:- start:764 stop:1543 length:780 start_codon:yes stop_codon:yes gene_type:complete
MKNNPFDAHNIEHLSASSINQFISSPCHWLLKISGHRGKSNPAMWRGTVVDNIISDSFYWTIPKDKKLHHAITQAEIQFEDLFEFNSKKNTYDSLKVTAELENIKRYLEVALPFYSKLGTPKDCQKKIEIEFESIPVPIIGYIDLQYEGVIRDIKTTGRLLKNIPSSICRQLSLYGYAEDSVPYADFIHVTKAKAEVVSIEITDVEKRVSELKNAAYAMMNVLSYSDDIRTVASLFYPDFDDWRWSEEDIEAAKNLWSI